MSLTSKLLAVALVLALIFGAAQSVRLDRAQDFHKEYVAEINEKLITAYKEAGAERDRAEQAAAEIGVAYNEGVKNAATLYDTTIDRLNSDNRELRLHWQSALRRASASEAGATGGSVDGEAEQLREDVGEIVRDSATADASIVSLQDQLNSYLCQVNGEPFPGYHCN